MARKKTAPVAGTRYVLWLTEVWAHGEGASVSLFEISEAQYEYVKSDHNENIFDLDENPTNIFNRQVVQGREPDEDDDEELLSEELRTPAVPLQLAEISTKMAGATVKTVEVIITTE
jgi:hypothetical protein